MNPTSESNIKQVHNRQISGEIKDKNQFEENYPSKQVALQIMKKLDLHSNIVKHQLAVMREARDLAHNITKFNVDYELINIGALMHDIGRIRSHSLEHGAFGGDIIRSLGFSEKIARIAERHSMAGLTPQEAIRFNLPLREYQPQTLEEKIVCVADKYLIGTKKVSIQERFQRWIEKYGRSPFLVSQLEKALNLEEEILRLIF